MIRPDFSGSGRDYSEPAERIDTGEYAVDRNPSDMGGDGRNEDDEGGTDSVDDETDDVGGEANDVDDASDDER